jgi:alginate O-acetyltransferase complex protein AlgI
MVFSSTIFLFGFLPIVLLAYYLMPRELKNFFLLCASLIFYFWGEKQYTLILVGSIFGNFIAGELLAKYHSRWLLAAAVAGNLSILLGFKYANFLVNNLNWLLGYEAVHLRPVHLPIGVSFFTFQGIAYVVDVFTRVVPPAPNPVRYALYAALFPHLVAGPIVRYRDIVGQLKNRPFSLDQTSSGVRRLMIGLSKKLIIANTLGQYADAAFRLPVEQMSAGLAWLALTCYTMQIYFDFSGYSDMAIGLGRLFGFEFLENFNYPYIAKSVTEFWRRWHISLSTWLRDYVYIPMGGNRVSPWRTYANLLIVFLMCGAWHGASWTFVIWGAWHGAFLVIERLGMNRMLEKLPSPFRHGYTLGAVMLGWVFFRAQTIGQAWEYMTALFGFGTARFAVSDFWNLELQYGLLVAVSCCLPVVPWVKKHWLRDDNFGWRAAGLEWCGLATCASLGIIVLPCLCSATYNPFLYFRF